jgi:antirestriction protein ArdC
MTQLTQQLAHWRGSVNTAATVKQEIADRWGEAEAKRYNPTKNCFTFKTWEALGYRVKKGEKAIRSVTYIEVTEQNAREGEALVIRKYPKTVCLFYITQVEKK